MHDWPSRSLELEIPIERASVYDVDVLLPSELALLFERTHTHTHTHVRARQSVFIWLAGHANCLASEQLTKEGGAREENPLNGKFPDIDSFSLSFSLSPTVGLGRGCAQLGREKPLAQ